LPGLGLKRRIALLFKTPIGLPYVCAYWPKVAITDGTWTPPQVLRSE